MSDFCNIAIKVFLELSNYQRFNRHDNEIISYYVAESPVPGRVLDLTSGLRLRKSEKCGKRYKGSGFHLHCGRE
jgi:hypothetical protein